MSYSVQNYVVPSTDSSWILMAPTEEERMEGPQRPHIPQTLQSSSQEGSLSCALSPGEWQPVSQHLKPCLVLKPWCAPFSSSTVSPSSHLRPFLPMWTFHHRVQSFPTSHIHCYDYDYLLISLCTSSQIVFRFVFHITTSRISLQQNCIHHGFSKILQWFPITYISVSQFFRWHTPLVYNKYFVMPLLLSWNKICK